MKQANNNEVDLLLRSLARGRDGAALQDRAGAGDGNRPVSDHLDADELNSYSEGVVPAPARARYTEHLADCDACRSIVVSLTQAAGTAIRSGAPEQKGGVSFWQKLASFFSPAVLRYAVPALVLAAVIGIILLAMRQPRQSDFIAQNQPAAPAAPSSQLGETESPNGQPTDTAASTVQGRAESFAANDSVEEQKNLQNKFKDDTRVAEGAGTGTGEIAKGVTTAKDAGQRDEPITRLDSPPTYAPEPKAAAPTSVGSTATSEADKSTMLAKEQSAKREDRERQPDTYQTTTGDEHGPNRSAAPRSGGAPASNRRLDGLSTARGGPYQEKKAKVGEKENEVETRTVSGRRFAREGNAWVDTAYDPSRTPVKVARGSEHFRGLVADEPGLRAIAEQLNGVIIVVWKNRAYRIQ